jgi:hypothetical protein
VTSTARASDEIAALVEERDFLLASLDDLEREHDAGDVDKTDYLTLRDDYTARAAAVIRDIDAKRAPRPEPRPPRRWGRTVVWALAIAAFSVLAGVLVAQMSGSRRDGESATGDVRENTRQLLADASSAMGAGDYDDAIGLYTDAIELSPSNAEARTYRGWAHSLAGDDDAALEDLDAAVDLDPEYADARVFRTVVAVNLGRFAEAAADLAVFDTLDPPSIMRQLVDGQFVRERVIAGVLLVDDPPTLAESGFLAEDVRAAAEFVADGTNPNPRGGVDLLDTVLQADPNDAAARAYKGWILARVGVEAGDDAVTSTGLAELDAALAIDPGRADAHVYRAFTLLYGLDDPAGAKAAIEAYDALGDTTTPLVKIDAAYLDGLRADLAAATTE